MILQAKVENLKLISCPEHCRKKFRTWHDLNLHLSKKHNLNYKIDHDPSGHAWKLRTK